ncbi:MAG: TonB-dependent receptor, partial [Candidatus Acidiferrales bacterium]
MALAVPTYLIPSLSPQLVRHLPAQLAKQFRAAAMLIGALILSVASVFGQINTGEIGGTVKDPSGGLVAGATVVATQSATGIKYTAIANGSGEYLLAQLPIGMYKLTVDAPGFKQSVLSSVPVHIGDKLRQEFVLQLGDRNETVIVGDTVEPLQLESAEIKDVVQHDQVIALPLKERQFLDLAMLSEGVVRPPGGTRGDALQQAGTLVNVLGQRSGHNLYLVDGVTVTDQHFNNMVLSPSVDSIQEFNIEKTSYAPEFGGKSGAVINVVTKSGSNSFHGSAFEFVRNDIFDAKNFFDSATAPIPPFRQNQFGGSLGGPVVKNKTFFFVSYEGQRIRKSLTQTFSVPTAAMRTGNFAGLRTIYDPTNIAGGQRQPFSANTIPAPRLDPVAVALLAKIPLPNLPGVAQNLRASDTQRIGFNNYSARLDHQF